MSTPNNDGNNQSLDDEMYEDDPEYRAPTAQEIARRALIVHELMRVAYGSSRDDAIQWLQATGLWADLSPNELAFIQNPHPTEKERINLSWGWERLVPLLWCIKKIQNMPPLTSQCDVSAIKREAASPSLSTSEFVQSAELRPESEIKAEYDKIWHAHWRAVDANIHGRPAPDGLDGEVILERHHGIGWVLQGGDWDHVCIDT